MGNKRRKPEDILTKLRHDEVVVGQGVACIVVMHNADCRK